MKPEGKKHLIHKGAKIRINPTSHKPCKQEENGMKYLKC